jgi:hypothetical protein
MNDKQEVDPESPEHELETFEDMSINAELMALCGKKYWSAEDAMQIIKGLTPTLERHPGGKIKLSQDYLGDALCGDTYVHEPFPTLSFEEGTAALARHKKLEKERKQSLSNGEVYAPSPTPIGSDEEKMTKYVRAREEAHSRLLAKLEFLEKEISEMLDHWIEAGLPRVSAPIDFISWAFKNGYGIPWSEDPEFNTWASNVGFEVPWLDANAQLRDNTCATEPFPPSHMKKAAMLKELVGIWPSIENDLSEVSRPSHNDLKKAKVRHGYWDVEIALKWAWREGKLSRENKKLENFIQADPDSVLSALIGQLINSK